MLFGMLKTDASDTALSENPDTVKPRPWDDDTPLWRAAGAGDTRAFEQLVGRYERLIYRTVYFTVRNAEDAADLTQEILLRVWRGLPTYRGDARFLTWLFRIVRNTCTDHLRRKQHDLPISPQGFTDDDGDDGAREIADPAPDADPAVALECRARAVLVRDAMARLSEEHRILIVMRDMEGATYEQMAAALGLELGTVKSRLSRARAQLRSALSASGMFDEHL